MTVVSAAVANSAPGGLALNGKWGTGAPPDPKVANGVAIEAAGPGGATIHQYTVTVVFRPKPNLTSAQADCLAGAGETGTGLRNVATAVVGGDRTAPQDTCVEVPRTVFDKELRSIDPNPGGTFSLRYELTVDRFGNGAPYTLRDSLHFPATVSVTSAKAVNVAPGPVLVNPNWNGTSDPLVASGIALGDGERHTYTVLVVAAVDPTGTTPGDRDCLLAGAEQASGFSNTAALATNDTTVDDSTCGEIPPPDPDPDPSLVHVAKDFAGPATPQDDGTLTVTYRVIVTNRGASKTTYDLDDRFRLGGGLTIKSASVANTAPGAIGVNGAWNGTTTPRVVAGQVIEPGAIHSYTVALRVATAPTISASDLDCTLAPGQLDTGLRNTATAVADGVEHTAAAARP